MGMFLVASEKEIIKANILVIEKRKKAGMKKDEIKKRLLKTSKVYENKNDNIYNAIMRMHDDL